MKDNTIKLVVTLALLIGLWAVSATFQAAVLFFFVITVFSFYITFKYRDFKAFDVVMAVAFGVMCMPQNIPIR